MKKFIITFSILLFLSSFIAFAQGEANADIYGTVVDDQENALPGVNVSLTGERIGELTAITSKGGKFRFKSLPPGPYEIKLTIPGFKTYIETLELSAGDTAELKIPMELGEISEEVLVKATSPLVTTKKTKVSSTITKEEYEHLPTAKSLSGILDMVPGILIDATDVGQSQYGEEITGMGANRQNSSYVMDGGNVSSARFSGKLGATMNMNAVEEVEVTQGAHDVEAEAGGFRVNFLTKRGGNRVSGDIYVRVEDNAFEFDATLPQEMQEYNPNWIPPGINHVGQYGFNFGGPILKDHVWYFLSYNAQDTKTRTLNDDEQRGFAPSYIGKLNFQYKTTMLNLQYQQNASTTFFSVWTDPSYFTPKCVWDVESSSEIYQAELQHVWGNLILDLKYTFMNSGGVDKPRGSTLDNNQGQGAYNLKKTMYSDTDFWVVINGETQVLYQGTLPWWEDTNQRQHFKGNGNYFLEDLAGGDHEIKVGGEYHDAGYIPQNIYPNHRIIYIFAPGDPPDAPRPEIEKYDNNYDRLSVYTPKVGNIRSRRMDFYLQDTATYGRFTFNLGLRYDKIWFQYLETVGAGYKHRVFGAPQGVAEPIPAWEPYVGDIKVEPYRIDAMPGVFSPRFSVNYDLTGDGKNVVKLSTAMYGPKLTGRQGSRFWPLSFRGISVPFWDMNGNYRPDFGEFDPLTPFEIDELKANPPENAPWVGLYSYGGFNKYNPEQTQTNKKYADDYVNPKQLELTLTYERELMADFAVSASAMYKRTYDEEWTRPMLDDGTMLKGIADKQIVPWAYDEKTEQWVFRDKATVEEITGHGVVGTYYTNHPVNHWEYTGIKLEANKRLSNGWMMSASLVLQSWVEKEADLEWRRENNYWIDDYTPTNYTYYHNTPYSLGALNEGYYMNSRWIFKLNGLVQLPLGVNVSWNLRAREGYPVDRGYPVHRFYGSYMYPTDGTKFGDNRLPTNYILNLGVEKAFNITENVTATLLLNAFNATNHLNVEKKEWRPGVRQGIPINVSNPGHIQFGARINF